ncbi:MAG: flavodoxin family protein, partial [Oscillospiraceae bacterium]
MKYAVIYLSETGNTEELAKNIYVSLPGNDKTITEAGKITELPEADFYFIGFPVKNRICGIEIMNILEQLGNVKVA